MLTRPLLQGKQIRMGMDVRKVYTVPIFNIIVIPKSVCNMCMIHNLMCQAD